MPNKIVSINEVLLRWAFSEVTAPRTREWCLNEKIRDIQSRIEHGYLKSVSDLSHADEIALLGWISEARCIFVGKYLERIRSFVECNLTQEDVRELISITGMIDGGSPMREYVLGTSTDPTDARKAALEHGCWTGNAEPVVVGHDGVLVEGTKRATCFLLFGAPGDWLRAFVPTD